MGVGLGRRGEAQGFYGFIIIHYFMQFLCSFYSGVFEFSLIK